MKCGDCKYFNYTISRSNGVLPYGHCISDSVDGEDMYRGEGTFAENWDTSIGIHNDNIKSEGSYGENGSITIGENFGCIHFQENEKKVDKKELFISYLNKEISNRLKRQKDYEKTLNRYKKNKDLYGIDVIEMHIRNNMKYTKEMEDKLKSL